MKPLPILYRALAAACALFAITPMTSAQIVQAPIPQIVQGPIQLAPAGYAPFYFNRNKPKLVVLLHGVTPQQGEAPDQRIGGSGHARHYWGFQFIKALQGEVNGDWMNVITPTTLGFRGRTPMAADWHPATLDASSGDLAPICFPTSPLGLLPEYPGSAYLKNYISLMCGGANTMVMINTRKGDKHLMPQVAETIDEIYMSYLLAFGGLPQAKQPQIYFVTHSFGGIIARTILANPSAGDLWGNKLTAEQRAKADYLRKRVVLLCTLAGPHEGTLIGDPASDVANYISSNGTNVITQFFNTFNQYTPDFLDLDFTSEDINQKATDFVEIALDAVSGKRDCLEDLRRMKEYNAGILKPNVERRLTNGDAVPIFTIGGRCPGGRFIDQSRRFPLLHIAGEVTPIHAINNIDVITGPRFSSDAAALNLVEGVMHLYGYGRAGKRPWGNAEAAIGDRFSSPWAGVGPATARPLAASWSPDGRLLDLAVDFLIGDPYVQYEADGEWDSDGFLAWDSANAYHLTGSNFYRLYDEAFYGSNLPWDIDNHGSIMHSAANGAWIYNELITQAGPTVSQGKRRSIWNINDQPQTPSNALRVVVEEIEDIQQTAAKKLDVGSGADFMITVRINELATTRTLTEGDKHVLLPPFIHSRIPSTVIPIQISVIELDNPGQGDPHDICVLSPQKGQSTVYLFYDTRTNKIMGDKMANGGDSFFVTGWTSSNQIRCKLRITQILPE